MRNPSSLQVSVQEIERKRRHGHAHRETTGGLPLGNTPVEAKRVEAGPVEVMEEKGGNEEEGFRVGVVATVGE